MTEAENNKKDGQKQEDSTRNIKEAEEEEKNVAESEIEHNYTDHNCHNCQDHQESDGSNTSSNQTIYKRIYLYSTIARSVYLQHLNQAKQ